MRQGVILLCLALTGCGVVPTRLFQKTVPMPISNVVTEEHKQSAELLTHGVINPPALETVAERLSDSLGKPAKFLPSTTTEQVEASASVALTRLESNISALQKQVDDQNKFLAKYAGTKLENTGFDIASWGGGFLLIGLVILAIACPPVMTLLFFALRRMKAAAGIVVNELEAAAQSAETQDAVKAIKSKIAKSMQAHPDKTTALKATITNLKS